MRKTKIRTITPYIFISFLFLIGVNGCGSDKNGDFSPFSSQSFHSFDETGKSLINHANYLRGQEGTLSECTECHGEDLKGVDNEIGGKDRSCYSCHNVDYHLVVLEEPDRDHSSYMIEHNWNMDACYVCHNSYETDQRVSLGGSCSNSSCHNQATDGLFNCNTCHGSTVGDGTYPANWAPPEDLMGNRFNTERGVGVHQSHVRLTTGNFGVIDCDVCHVMPDSWESQGHISDNTLLRAEVVFGLPATQGGAEPVYDFDDMTCSSIYCHGGKTSLWTQVGGWTECGSCHSMPPSAPHIQNFDREDCYRCHGSMIDSEGTIINPQLHANGFRDMN